MTDAHPRDDSPDAAGDAVRGGSPRPSIRIRRADGDWEELEVRPRDTGDPDLDRVWSMGLDELDRVLQDPNDPLHEKAGQVAKEMTEPLVRAANQMLEPYTRDFRESLERLVPSLMPATRPMDTRFLEAIRSTPIEIELPAAATPTDIAEAAEAAESEAQELRRRQVIAMEGVLAHMQQVETERAARAPAERRRALRTELAGWIAAGGAVLAVIATVVVWALSPR